MPVAADLPKAGAAAVAITSANAVRHAPKEVIAALAALPCHAVGKRTAEARPQSRVLSVSEGPGDAEALATVWPAMSRQDRRLSLWPGGGFPAFEQRLEAAGVPVQAVETYDTLRLIIRTTPVLARLSGQPADAVLLYSAKAVRRYRP